MAEDLRTELAALRPRLRRFAATLARTADAADELTQAVLAKALERLGQFEPNTRLDRWLFRIAYTTWIDETRSRARRPEGDPDEIERAGDGGYAVRQAEARIELDRVRTAMGRLPDDQRAVLALVVFEGLSYRETAEALGVPPGTVMSRLARARLRLSEARAQPRSVA